MEQAVSKVPTDVGALLQEHAAFFPHVITKIIRHHLSEDELQDLTQDILLALHARSYLDRCRVYEAQCVAEGKAYSFLASLRAFIERLTKNYLRDRHAAKRDPCRTVSLGSLTGGGDKFDPHGKREGSRLLPATLTVAATQDEAAIASARLQRLRARLVAGRRVIGGLPAALVVDDALGNGGDLDKYARRRLRDTVLKEGTL